jgi:hypothetical protein
MGLNPFGGGKREWLKDTALRDGRQMDAGCLWWVGCLEGCWSPAQGHCFFFNRRCRDVERRRTRVVFSNTEDTEDTEDTESKWKHRELGVIGAWVGSEGALYGFVLFLFPFTMPASPPESLPVVSRNPEKLNETGGQPPAPRDLSHWAINRFHHCLGHAACPVFSREADSDATMRR